MKRTLIHKCLFLPLLWGLPSLAGVSDAVCAVRVSKVLCSNRQDPLGVDPSRVTFSWQIQSDERNEVQTGYQILVATSSERLADGKADVWNSGKVKGRKSLLLPYRHTRLGSARTYFWKVRVWDKNGVPSAWSSTARFVTALRTTSNWRNARWIGHQELPPESRLVPGIHISDKRATNLQFERPVVPLFRNVFEIRKPVKEAFAVVSGLGHYDLYINGKRVGDDFLTPGWTDYEKTCLYNTYDIAALLTRGKNAVGAIVGNGFHNINPERYWKLSIAYGMPKVICLLRVLYEDGTEDAISTGAAWKTAPSPVVFSGIYGGEDYDARLEQHGWATAGFDDSHWANALLVEPPGGQLQPEDSFPLRIHGTFPALRIVQPAPGIWLYDFGQNCSGVVSLRVQGKSGQTLKLTPAELIDSQYLANQKASGKPYYWTYTIGGDEPEEWTPRFTYYGFRYVQVEGASPADSPGSTDQPKILELKLLHTRNSAPTRGEFACSNDLFNRIARLIDWAIRSNLASVVTDCPHREKLGWLEQTHLMGEAIHFRYDLYHLYSKQLRDMMEAQTADGLVPDIAPEYVEFESGFRDSPEWGSAAVILPMFLYRWYGDLGPARAAYPMMKKYVAYLGSKTAGDLLSHGLGDWYDLGPRFPGEAQLTPKALTATAIYYYDLKLLGEYAGLLGYRADAARYNQLAYRVRRTFNDAFFNEQTGMYSTGSQTAMAMPLCLGLVEDSNRERVFANLIRTVEQGGKALTAGDVGFHFLVKALSDGNAADLLYAMNSREDIPGYGFQLAKGATALTESWAALEEVSNNHLMLGHLMEWFFTGLAGINQAAGSVAYERIVLRPQMIEALQWVDAAFESPHGTIRSCWKRDAGGITLEIDVPVNTRAEIHLPLDEGMKVYETGSEITVKKRSDGACVVQVGSGRYRFQMRR